MRSQPPRNRRIFRSTKAARTRSRDDRTVPYIAYVLRPAFFGISLLADSESVIGRGHPSPLKTLSGGYSARTVEQV